MMLGAKQKFDILTDIRTKMLYAMRNGQTLAFDFDQIQVDMEDDFSGDLLPTQVIFNYEFWRSSYGMFLTEDELLQYKLEDGCSNEFHLAVVSRLEEEAEMVDAVRKVPHVTSFHRIKIID